MLVRKGVSPNESDDQHRTALSVACTRGNVKMVQRLLSYGALVNESQSLVDALLSNTNVPESSQI
jgi:ankyrin repeat protein